MTLHGCFECYGTGWIEDGRIAMECATCCGMGLLDDDEPDEDPEYEPAWPTISDRHQFGY